MQLVIKIKNKKTLDRRLELINNMKSDIRVSCKQLFYFFNV